MPLGVSPASITAAALVMQFCLWLIASVGALWVRRDHEARQRFSVGYGEHGTYVWTLLVFPLLTVGCLVFSDQFTAIWRPLSPGVSFAFWRWTTALFLVFILDVTWTAILVQTTGGSHRSPFTSIYFILPALALFLRESPRRVVVYTVVISFFFVVGLVGGGTAGDDATTSSGAYGFVSVACLALSVLIGYLARPR